MRLGGGRRRGDDVLVVRVAALVRHVVVVLGDVVPLGAGRGHHAQPALVRQVGAVLGGRARRSAQRVALQELDGRVEPQPEVDLVVVEERLARFDVLGSGSPL